MERLDKIIAATGRWSRREAAQLIRTGRVTVDGAVVTEREAKFSSEAAFVVDGIPDSTRYYTERFGVDCCVIEMRSELTNKVHSVVDDLIVKKVLKDGTAEIGEKYLKAIGECATEYTEKIMRKLREYGYNEELAKLHFLGGGAMLMKHFGKLDKNRVRFIEDINANAKGYEYLSHQRRIRKLRQK